MSAQAAPERKYSSAVASVDADGRFCGYASLFGRMDLSGDVVEPGAFARTLAQRGVAGVGMLLEHDPTARIGAWVSVQEDRRGLWVEGRLSDAAAGRRAARAMGAGRIDGLSIGFRTVTSRTERTAGVRRLLEIDLWEVSVVTSPMLPEARARAAGACRAEAGGAALDGAVDAGLVALMRRQAAIFRQTR